MLSGMRSTLASLKLPKTYPSPAVKWVGGKADLANDLIPLLPLDVRARRWHEPFAGGAALFFQIQPRQAVLSDMCADLIALYEVLQASPESFFVQLWRLEQISGFTDHEAQYETIRRFYNEGAHANAEQRAAWFLYLNKAGFNGLHRVNGKGLFNVPFGKKKKLSFDRENLVECGKALTSAELHHAGFESVLERARPGDVVYFDPPYLGTFSGYSGEFGVKEQIELSRVFRELDRRGVITVLSTSDEPLIRELYAGFEVTEVRAGRAVSAKASGRGKVQELVIRGETR